MNKVSVEKKLAFIDWVWDQLEPQEHSAFRLLYRLGQHEKFQERIRFVENAKKYSYGIEMSATCSVRSGFTFFGPTGKTNDSGVAFHYFSAQDTESKIHIQINFKGKYSHALYMAVLEDDEPSLETDLPDEEYVRVEEAITYMENLGKRQLIDYALDTKDEALFKKLVMK
ncbi:MULTISPECIES: YpiB family protein [Bacillus]|uniref:UPF0302 domain-containing protein n=1 Tax=Bacillus thuringiensis subsp. medellin TaxID=79672 RepID=A0A9X6MUG1_BACTV|nr:MULTISPECIES: YpiB family protein [Bacillus]MBW3492756.1 YpiB family protein [Bacillus sp. FDAARGOS_1420]MEB9339028.1 YpiB family protein [Bacillus cereus]OUB89323.1 hypothetical protein BK784_26885 [Bacillus thuringiensis serovar medellin]CCW04276.1 BH1670 unknown conserved protein in B. subtilis [Bacillus sp. GeD10]